MADPPNRAFDDATATLVRSAKAPRPLGARIRVLGASSPRSSYRLDAGSCVVGSAAGCDIVIAEPTVSRQHAELTVVPEGIAVQDLGSRNGTYYLGTRVEKIVLALGGRIEIGAATLAIDADTQALEQVEYPDDAYRGIVGVSPAMHRLFGMLGRLEGSLVTVLVEGESGVGKELIARALHEGSSVSTGPLVVVNCGAIPRELVASELFGHKKGAFTGALAARRGAFESADGGTLFLDEIGELPLDVQPMLLRALESGEVRVVGGDQARHVKVRVVAATNRDLEAEVKAGRFREDLYYRLAVVRLRVPPLRERPEDVEPLARLFARASGLADLPGDVVAQLRARAFAGNARELRNAVQAYAALGVLPEASRSKDATLELALTELVDVRRPYAEQKEGLSERFTRVYLQALLAHTGGNQTAAARIAGLDRTYLGKLLSKHGLSKS
ncbi:MAG TPA: sigma 54-interacting transcriptional regulator [Minicystis sp.]|nr:sigma 54-interacting transcriptional regulator [Minicystis sp.]